MDKLIDKHAMNTWIGLTLWWKPKIVISALVTVGVLVQELLLMDAGELRFRDMAIPRTAFIYGMLWAMGIELITRMGRALYDGITEADLETLPLFLATTLEAIGLYFGYTMVIGLTTVMTKATIGTYAFLVMEGLQLFFFVAILCTQLVMTLVHWRGSKEAVTSWVSGLKRNWSFMQDLSKNAQRGDMRSEKRGADANG